MKQITKKGKIKILSILLACIITLSTVAIVLVLRKDDPSNPNNPTSPSGPNLVYDLVKGEAAEERVENAQYLPDIDTFIAVNNEQPELYAESPEPSNISLEDFQSIIDKAAHIQNYAGAGKYLGYDIYDIKNELAFVIKNVPAFNQWFTMPTMREEQGYIDIPYYENWSYLLELELNPLKLNVTRVCTQTRSAYMDFENKTFVENNPDGSFMIQYEVMKTSYFIDNNGDEVIECQVYSVGVTNVDNNIHFNHYNPNESDYHPFEYQYLRNVKDKTLITYHITAAERAGLNTNSPLFEGWAANPNPNYGDDSGMDIRGLHPYGVWREFRVVDYSGYDQITDLALAQRYQSFYYPTATGDITYYDGSITFDIASNNVALLAEAIGISEENYIDATDTKDCLDIFSKHIVDNFELKNNWSEIYRRARKDEYIIANTINGPHYGIDLPISDAYGYVSIYWNTDMQISLDADIYDITKFDTTKKYSRTLALREVNTGELIIIHKDYNLLTNNGHYYVFGNTSAHYYLKTNEVLRINKTGEYDLTFLITMEDNDEDIIVFDTLSTLLLRYYGGVKLENYTDSETGITYKYDCSGKGGRFILKVTEVASQ